MLLVEGSTKCSFGTPSRRLASVQWPFESNAGSASSLSLCGSCSAGEKRGFCFTSDASGAQTQVGGSEHEGQVIEDSTRMPVAVKRSERSTGIMVQSIGTP